MTAFYTFLLEFEDRYLELKLRSKYGGSSEPFISHLFKGGLIFESLLKRVYPQHRNGTLGNIFKGPDFKKDFLEDPDTFAENLQSVLDSVKDTNIRTAFETTAKLRNTAGHNLVWQDVENVLGNPENYRKLFEQEVNAFFYVAEKKFIKKEVI